MRDPKHDIVPTPLVSKQKSCFSRTKKKKNEEERTSSLDRAHGRKGASRNNALLCNLPFSVRRSAEIYLQFELGYSSPITYEIDDVDFLHGKQWIHDTGEVYAMYLDGDQLPSKSITLTLSTQFVIWSHIQLRKLAYNLPNLRIPPRNYSNRFSNSYIFSSVLIPSKSCSEFPKYVLGYLLDSLRNFMVKLLILIER